MKFTNKDAKIRLYDGTPVNRWYIELCLDSGDFSGPIGIPEHDEILVLDRGQVTPCSHYISSNDSPVMEPVTISFSAIINDSQRFLFFMDWIEGKVVNGQTTLTTKNQYERILSGADLSFFDPEKKCFDLEYHLVGTTHNICYIFHEIYFKLSEQTFSEAEDGITLSLTGNCYGTIERSIDFSSGLDIVTFVTKKESKKKKA